MKQFLLKAIGGITNRLSTRDAEILLKSIVTQRADSLPPDEALRFLFRLDAFLYSLQGQKSIVYGKGVHTKHRHLRYHDFFIGRIAPGDSVLDIGCGNGAVDYDIAEKTGARVTGIDISEENIAAARRQFSHPRIRYIAGNALSDLPQERFDVVILSNVLEHLPDRPQFLGQVQGITKAQRILIRVPLFEREWRVPLKQELGVEWRLDPTHETEYTLESFQTEMGEAGLSIDHLEVRWGEIWAQVSAKC
ncbi:MAG: methyltransferase domain-containing protein [Anaerolineae bacterium]|nr:methyltransferase domain-containing protein [Anaerolineae bacterium]